MMTREQRMAAAERCQAAKLAYLVVPREDEDPGLLIPGAKDASEHEFQRTIVPLATVRDVLRQALRRIDAGKWLAVVGAVSIRRTGKRDEIWRSLDRRLQQQAAALEMAQAFIPCSGEGELEFGGSVLGASWGEGIEAAFHAVKKAESVLILLLNRATWQTPAALAEDDEERVKVERIVSDLEAAILRE